MSEKKKALAQFHRDNIIIAAEKLFMINGIEKTTMDDIAKESEYSKATLYVYFKNKDEIKNWITLNSMKMLHERIKRAFSISNDIIPQYYLLCGEIVRYYNEYPLYFESTLAEINVDIENSDTPTVFKEIFEVGELIDNEIGNFITKGIEKKVIRQDILVPQTIAIFWASISGIVRMADQKQKYFNKAMNINKDEFMRYGFETLLHAILIQK